ncbi:solute carrier family 40 protein member 1-like isoform X3 [Sycon ciliatum]|uniref:solute carrier family 40 protein member 1-like isoform X3 n=1 Tax=Sycon ciliatum TaxID=27933 RepID=UPI0031F64443
MAKTVTCSLPRSVLALCGSHFLSTWGDRMWSYAVAIFLVEIGCGSLLLPAVFGLVLAAVNFLGSTLIGQWVDSSVRLRVVKVSLFAQNLLVTFCAGFLILLLQHQSGSYSVQDSVYYLSLVLIIVFAAAANLIGQATTIAVERDWVVVLTAGDADLLARVNAIMRRIDLINKIVSPLPVSFLMTKSVKGLTDGAIFIAGWNILSGFLEYILLLYVYRYVPALSVKSRPSSESSCDEAEDTDEVERCERQVLASSDCDVVDDTPGDEDVGGEVASPSTTKQEHSVAVSAGVEKSSSATRKGGRSSSHAHESLLRRILYLILLPYTTVVLGWKVYKQQSVLRAGLSLALLYMTVLGFNGITNGFLYSQGLEVWQVSVCQALGALFGVLGTFIYHPLRRRCGVINAGLVAIWAEAVCLSLCAASVFLSGNPSTVPVQKGICDLNATDPGDSNLTYTSSATSSFASTTPIITAASSTSSSSSSMDETSSVLSTSLIFFLIGIVTARIGLWMFDLATTQLYQMEVAEEHRGTVGGVQNALNSNMDLLHFVLVIGFPDPTQFGGLVVASFAAVVVAAVLYTTFARSRSASSLSSGLPLCCVVYSGSRSGDDGGGGRCGQCCCSCCTPWTRLPDFNDSPHRHRQLVAASTGNPDDVTYRGSDIIAAHDQSDDDDGDAMAITNAVEL